MNIIQPTRVTFWRFILEVSSALPFLSIWQAIVIGSALEVDIPTRPSWMGLIVGLFLLGLLPLLAWTLTWSRYDMSKIEAGRVELEIRELDLRKTVESVTATFAPEFARKGLTLTLLFDDDMLFVYADKVKVKQVLLNLVSNAIEFTDHGGITIHAGLSSRGVTPGGEPLFAEICIEDTGIGIKEGEIEKLFDKFSQLDISTIRRYEGTGLGLSIARGLVVLHKGVIWASSIYGKGSRFSTHRR